MSGFEEIMKVQVTATTCSSKNERSKFTDTPNTTTSITEHDLLHLQTSKSAFNNSHLIKDSGKLYQEEKENSPTPLRFTHQTDDGNNYFELCNDHGKHVKSEHGNLLQDENQQSYFKLTNKDCKHNYEPVPLTSHEKLPLVAKQYNPNTERFENCDWYDTYYGSYSCQGYHLPHRHFSSPEIPASIPSINHTTIIADDKFPNKAINNIVQMTKKPKILHTDQQARHGPRHRSDGRCDFTIASHHSYRDFSGVPPTEEDRERYNNKKKEYARRIKNCYTTNEMDDCDGNEAMKQKRGRGNREARSGPNKFIGFMGTNFPARLHDLLSHDEDISNIITWLPHGRSWIVLDKKEFVRKVAPSHFQISKFESFTRQVNGWGFKRITQGPDINSYYHELFLRGMPHLIQWMKRSTSSGSGRRKIRSHKEPDFHAISQIHPIPDYYGASRDHHHDFSPPTLEESASVYLPQLNSSDCREVLDILNEPSPTPPTRKGYDKMKSSKLVSGVEPVMCSFHPALPSPIQPKAKRIKISMGTMTKTHNVNGEKSNTSNKVIHDNIDHESPLSSKEIREVKEFWSGNCCSSLLACPYPNHEGSYYQELHSSSQHSHLHNDDESTDESTSYQGKTDDFVTCQGHQNFDCSQDFLGEITSLALL